MAIPAIIGVAARSAGASLISGARFAGKASYNGLKAGIVRGARGAIAAQRNEVLNRALGVYDSISAARAARREQERTSRPLETQTEGTRRKNQEKAEKDERENQLRQEKAHADALGDKTQEQTSVLKVISKDTKDILAGIELLVEEGISGNKKKEGGLLSGLMSLLAGLTVFSKGFLGSLGAFFTKMASKVGSTIAAMVSRAFSGVMGTLARAGSGIARTAGTVGKAALTAGGALAAKAGLASRGAAATGPAVARAAGTTGGIVGKAAGRSALKKIPVIGAGVGLALAANRAASGDWAGAGLEATSGALSLIPGLGTAASLGVDAAIVARDLKRAGASGTGAPDFSNVQSGSSTVSASRKPSVVLPQAGGQPKMEALLESLTWTVRTMLSNMISPNKGIYTLSLNRVYDATSLGNDYANTNTNGPSGAPSSAPEPTRADSGSSSTLAPVPAYEGLGSLSAQYESGNRGSAAVGYDSVGGTSYGKYQIATRTGTMDQFMKFLQHRDPETFERLQAAGPADSGKNGQFARVWRQLAQEGKLGDHEHEFIKKTHYEPGLSAIRSDSLRNMISKSPALQDVLWSTTVQHGGKTGGNIFNKVYREGMSEQDLIDAVYNERGTRFGRSTPEIRASVQNRFRHERRNALAMANDPANSVAAQMRDSVVSSSVAWRAPMIIPQPVPVPTQQKAPSGGTGASVSPMITRNPDTPIQQYAVAILSAT